VEGCEIRAAQILSSKEVCNTLGPDSIFFLFIIHSFSPLPPNISSGFDKYTSLLLTVMIIIHPFLRNYKWLGIQYRKKKFPYKPEGSWRRQSPRMLPPLASINIKL